MKAVDTHINNADICRAGCSVLRNMTANNSKSTDKINNKQNIIMNDEQLRTEQMQEQQEGL